MTEVRNPYAAPDATVADVAVPHTAGPQPAQVRRACISLWLSFAITAVVTPISQMNAAAATGLGFGRGIAMVVTTILFAGLLTWWFTAKLGVGRNWMRWLLNILMGLSLLGLPLTLLGFGTALQGAAVSTLEVIAAIAQFGLSLYVLVLINSAPAREWFAAMKLSRT